MAIAGADVDDFGLDDMDARIVKTIIEKFDGGPVGVESLAAALGELGVLCAYLTVRVASLVAAVRAEPTADPAKPLVSSTSRHWAAAAAAAAAPTAWAGAGEARGSSPAIRVR